ncbi:MAG TPA: hypothetical protein PKH94_08985 [Bacteroidales bacterium]|nr:hypothetical protein [Bacteroidales bacterium]HNS47359.1 hypothetical protein [Bacteroidales bacterium]
MKRIFFPRTGLLNPLACFLLILIFLNFTGGCVYYYKVNTVDHPAPEAIRWENLNGKYFILHTPVTVYHIIHPTIDSTHLRGTVEICPDDHRMYVTTNTGKVNRFIRNNNPSQKKPYQGNVLNEVHLYTDDPLDIDKNNFSTIDLSSLKKMEIYYYAQASSRATWYVPAVGVPLLVVGIAAIVAAATSCPLVYIQDGNQWIFIGEIYGGATYPNLERDDYMILPGFNAQDGKYRLKLANELIEKQNTNLAELMLINHPEEYAVMTDKYGKMQTIFDARVPLSAQALDNRDFVQHISARDNGFFMFNVDDQKTSINSLILNFEKQQNAGTGKLVVNAKNTLWADYAYGEFTELMGTYYEKWAEKQKRMPGDRQLSRALKQDIPLSVYLETEKGWEFVDYYHVTGSLAARDMVMSIDLSGVKSDQVRIKLETGFMFWEVDYAAMDFSENIPVEVKRIISGYAWDEKGNDATGLLKADDDQYLKQYETGLATVVEYEAPADGMELAPGITQTVILHSKGYYEAIRAYDHHPEWFRLTALNHPHSLSGFSLKQFKKYLDENNIAGVK